MSFVEDVEERTTNDSNEIEEVKSLHLPHSVNAYMDSSSKEQEIKHHITLVMTIVR